MGPTATASPCQLSQCRTQAVSAITKKRVAQRSQQGLAQSKLVIENLTSSLKDLQTTAREWQNNASYASKRYVAGIRRPSIAAPEADGCLRWPASGS
jgi:hypothetical protein